MVLVFVEPLRGLGQLARAGTSRRSITSALRVDARAREARAWPPGRRIGARRARRSIALPRGGDLASVEQRLDVERRGAPRSATRSADLG